MPGRQQRKMRASKKWEDRRAGVDERAGRPLRVVAAGVAAAAAAAVAEGHLVDVVACIAVVVAAAAVGGHCAGVAAELDCRSNEAAGGSFQRTSGAGGLLNCAGGPYQGTHGGGEG
eukprot:scaffold3578_cov18-Tisochrysis_lutea.AAC.1